MAETFDIVVANTNDAPTLANPIADQGATEDAAFTFQFAANVFADAGGQYIAVQRKFTTTASSSGEVVIQFVSGVDNPIVNGIIVN